jgi:hypothetical protein
LPQGQPADEATIAVIEAVERQRVACWNANDWRRLFAYYTDEFVRATLAEYGPDADEEIAADFLASPQPWDRRDWLPVRVRDVRLLRDGRAAAIVDTCEEVLFHVYEFVGVRWLIAEAVWLEDDGRSFCTYPAFTTGTPDP